MKWLILYFLVSKHQRLLDKFHDWQYEYSSTDYEMVKLGNRIDRIEAKIKAMKTN